MDKVKDLYAKAKAWYNGELEYTNGDALLLLVVAIHTVVHSILN